MRLRRTLLAALLVCVLPACGPGLVDPTAAGDGIGAERFVAVGDNGAIIVAEGTNPSVWTIATTPGAATLRSLAYGNGVVVAVGDAGLVWYSEDHGDNWEQGSISGGEDFHKVSFANDLFVTGGTLSFASFGIYTSSDGKTWTSRNTSAFGPTGQSIAGIAFGLGTWIMLDTLGDLTTSPDAITWTAGAASGIGSTESLVFNPIQNEFIAGDPAGQLYEGDPDTGFSSPITSGSGSPLVDFAIGGGEVFVLSSLGEVFRSSSGSAGPWSLVANLGDPGNAIDLTRDYDVVVGDVGMIFVRAAGAPGYDLITAPVAETFHDVIAFEY